VLMLQNYGYYTIAAGTFNCSFGTGNVLYRIGSASLNNKTGKFYTSTECGYYSYSNIPINAYFFYPKGNYNVRYMVYNKLNSTCGTLRVSRAQGTMAKTYSKGSTNHGTVTSNVSTAYPSNGRRGDYWYVSLGLQ